MDFDVELHGLPLSSPWHLSRMIRRIGTTCIDVDQAPAGCSPLSDLDQGARR
jgi:hypothetical protein